MRHQPRKENVADFLNVGSGYSLPRSAYYIDDISVVGAGDCPLELADPENHSLKLSNPSSSLEVLYYKEENKVQIRGEETISGISVWSMNGDRFELEDLSKNEFKLPKLSTGIYLFVVETNQQFFRSKLYLY